MESTLYTFRLADAGNVAHRPHSTGDDDGDTTNPKVSGRSKDNLPGNPIQPTSKAADVLDQLLLDNKARVFCGTTQLAAASKLGGVVGLAPTTGSSRGRAACGNLVRRNLGTRRCPHRPARPPKNGFLCGFAVRTTPFENSRCLTRSRLGTFRFFSKSNSDRF